MRIIRGFPNNKNRIDQPCIVTIGNFDGVHLGHQSIFEKLNQEAEKRNGQSVVVIFEPQPQEFFKQEVAPVRLTTLKEKLMNMKQHNIDCVIVLGFKQRLAELSATEFCEKLLLKGLNTQHMIVGDDFRFGKKRSAGYAELEAFAKTHGFTLEQTPTSELNNRRISSSWVREALAEGDFSIAEQILGRSFTICGRVRHGDKRGRELGYPTANIGLKHKRAPIKGVFVTTSHLNNGQSVASVSNLGTRPVFQGEETLLESHLFDFDDDLYGQTIKIEFHHKLRSEQKFESVEELKKQIDLDAQNAREFIAKKYR